MSIWVNLAGRGARRPRRQQAGTTDSWGELSTCPRPAQARATNVGRELNLMATPPDLAIKEGMTMLPDLRYITNLRLLFITIVLYPHPSSPHPLLFYIAITSLWLAPLRTIHMTNACVQKSTQVGMNTRTAASPGGVSRDGAACLYDLAALSDRDNDDMSAEVCQDAKDGAADANAARSSWERAAVEQERMMIDDASTLNDTRRECAEELRVQLPSVPEHFSSSSAAVTTSPSLVVSESGFPQRRRLRGKQSVSSKLAPNVNAIGTAARAECNPGHSSQWAGRLRIQAESIFRPRDVCVKLACVLCRGCSLPICLDCARKRVQCSRRI